MTCSHDFIEREIAVTADGYCPLCMSVEIGRLRAALIDIGDLADTALQGVSILHAVTLRDVIFRCAEAIAP